MGSFQEKSSSRLPRGPFSTSHRLSPCPGDKDIQTNPDISLAGLIPNFVLLSAEKLALPPAAAPSPAPPAGAAAEPLGCDRAKSRKTPLLLCFPSPSCPGTQCSGGLCPVTHPPVPPCPLTLCYLLTEEPPPPCRNRVPSAARTPQSRAFQAPNLSNF